MSADLDLLRQAAEAAGIKFATNGDGLPGYVSASNGDWRFGWTFWNPLIDDGDALRLAVKLRMCLMTDEAHSVKAGWPSGKGPAPTVDGTGPWYWKEWPHHHADYLTATRRAIVRAAAAIAKATKEQP